LRDLFPNDENRSPWKAWLRRFLLDLDSRIDFGLYQAKTWGRELYERFSMSPAGDAGILSNRCPKP